MTKTTDVVIAETGYPPAPLKADFGPYTAMLERMMRGAGYDGAVTHVDVAGGETLMGPAPGRALLVTGSPAGVYEDHGWIGPLLEALQGWAPSGSPLVGICFGHQAISAALGGTVEPSTKGWGVGVHTYERVEDWGGLPHRFSCAVSHQDQVTALPDGAARLAGSAFCPNGAIKYREGRTVSFQMHPEFEHDFAHALLSLRRDKIPAPVADLGAQTLKNPSDRERLGSWITNFLLGTELAHGD